MDQRKLEKKLRLCLKILDSIPALPSEATFMENLRQMVCTPQVSLDGKLYSRDE